jgi:hypothetical protein
VALLSALPMVGPVGAAKGRHSVDAKRDELDHSKAMYPPIQQKVTTILHWTAEGGQWLVGTI